MIGHEWSYKGTSFSNLTANTTRTIITNVDRNVPLRTDIFNRANYHGTYSSNTLAGGRIYDFEGTIWGYCRADRGTPRDALVALISPEPNPSDNAFYDLTWQDDNDNPRTVKAKVYQVPYPVNDINDPFIKFTFSLYAESPEVYDTTTNTATGFTGTYGGNLLSNLLPATFNAYTNEITATNAGGRIAPATITVTGACSDCHIINLTNGRHYSITGDTTLFVHDTTNPDNDPLKQLVVTDNGVDISSRRDHGEPLLLDPGANTLLVLDSQARTDIPVTITRRNAYLY